MTMEKTRTCRIQLFAMGVMAPLFFAGCVGQGNQQDVCQMAMDHMGSCVSEFQFSDAVVCDPQKQETANFLLGLDCDEIQAVYDAGQEVSWYEDVWDMAQGVADGVKRKYENTMDETVGPDFRITDIKVDPLKDEYYVEGTWKF
jgi:hypothetical protein